MVGSLFMIRVSRNAQRSFFVGCNLRICIANLRGGPHQSVSAARGCKFSSANAKRILHGDYFRQAGTLEVQELPFN